MPYVRRELRSRLNPILHIMIDEGIGIDQLSDILFCFCKKHVKPSYNNYKNFIGELRQCASEIKRRRLASRKFFMREITREEAERATGIIIESMAKLEIKADGDLNYILFKFCKYRTGRRGEFAKALGNCALKIEKELLAPYEDLKIFENGDV